MPEQSSDSNSVRSHPLSPTTKRMVDRSHNEKSDVDFESRLKQNSQKSREKGKHKDELKNQDHKQTASK